MKSGNQKNGYNIEELLRFLIRRINIKKEKIKKKRLITLQFMILF